MSHTHPSLEAVARMLSVTADRVRLELAGAIRRSEPDAREVYAVIRRSEPDAKEVYAVIAGGASWPDGERRASGGGGRGAQPRVGAVRAPIAIAR